MLKSHKEAIESQSSREERSMIRYYELPSLQTFAKKILSRAQSCSRDAIRLKITLTTPAGRPISLGRPRGGPHVPRRFGFTTRCDTIRSWKDARSEGPGKGGGREGRTKSDGGEATLSVYQRARARRLTGWRLQQILIAFQYGVEFQTKSSVEGREGVRVWAELNERAS